MSRVGKKILIIPEKTSVEVKDNTVVVKGPLGELSIAFKNDMVGITVAEGTVSFLNKNTKKIGKSLWGTYASHVENMIAGVNAPYSKKLILEGVGFKSEVAGTNLNLALGFSHPVVVPIPEGLTVTAEKNNITVTGINKDLVGQFTAEVRALKKPEPYKGKGFRYDDEVIRRKQGKKSA